MDTDSSIHGVTGVGGVALLLAAIALCYCCHKKRKNNPGERLDPCDSTDGGNQRGRGRRWRPKRWRGNRRNQMRQPIVDQEEGPALSQPPVQQIIINPPPSHVVVDMHLPGHNPPVGHWQQHPGPFPNVHHPPPNVQPVVINQYTQPGQGFPGGNPNTVRIDQNSQPPPSYDSLQPQNVPHHPMPNLPPPPYNTQQFPPPPMNYNNQKC